GYTIRDCDNKRVIEFEDLSQTDPNYGPISYLWQFGDPANTTSTIQGDTSFTYPDFGDYNVQLTVTNGSCTQTFSEEIRLVGDRADFTIDDANVCKNELFIARATGDPANIASYT